MMARGEADILGTGLLESRHPLLGIEARREESMGSLGIFVAVDAGIAYIMLSLAKHTVDAPMEEDAQAVLRESGTCLQITLGGLIGTLGIGSGGRCGRCSGIKGRCTGSNECRTEEFTE